MTLFDFMSDSPGLTFFIMWMIAEVVIKCVKIICDKDNNNE